MIVHCAWCEAAGLPPVMGTREPLDNPAITHGICPQHLAEQTGRIRERKASMATISVFWVDDVPDAFWDQLRTLLPDCHDGEAVPTGAVPFFRLEDRFGWDTGYVLPDGRVCLPDRNSGTVDYSDGPICGGHIALPGAPSAHGQTCTRATFLLRLSKLLPATAQRPPLAQP